MTSARKTTQKKSRDLSVSLTWTTTAQNRKWCVLTLWRVFCRFVRRMFLISSSRALETWGSALSWDGFLGWMFLEDIEITFTFWNVIFRRRRRVSLTAWIRWMASQRAVWILRRSPPARWPASSPSYGKRRWAAVLLTAHLLSDTSSRTSYWSGSAWKEKGRGELWFDRWSVDGDIESWSDEMISQWLYHDIKQHRGHHNTDIKAQAVFILCFFIMY